MNRVLVLGPCGAGKSTLAARLGSILNLRVIHLDALYWNPGWQAATDDAFHQRLRSEVAATDRWIIDGNYMRMQQLTLHFADTVIFLDFPRWRCMWQICRRIARHYGTTRPDMGADCPEKLDWEFIEYAWDYHPNKIPMQRKRIESLMSCKRVIILRSPREVEVFLERARTDQIRARFQLTE